MGRRSEVFRSGSAEAAAQETWGYNGKGELVLSDHSQNDSFDRSYLFDELGNRRKSAESTSLPTEENYLSNGLNQLTMVENVERIYDLGGNLIDDGMKEYQYDAFGKTVASAGSKKEDFSHRFSTKPYEKETGLYYYGYRYYDSIVGRWPSRDPIEERGGMNLYGFVFNNPINWVDILGLRAPSDVKVTGSSHGGLKAAHDTGTEALMLARREYEKFKSEARKNREPFNEPGPREYGGKICEHCDPATGKKTYYITITLGTWKSKLTKQSAAGAVNPEAADDCKAGDKKIGLWHIHPGYESGDGYGQGGWFSNLGDITVTNGWEGTDQKTGEKRHFNHHENKHVVPLTMSRATGPGQDTAETFMYNRNSGFTQYVEE